MGAQYISNAVRTDCASRITYSQALSAQICIVIITYLSNPAARPLRPKWYNTTRNTPYGNRVPADKSSPASRIANEMFTVLQVMASTIL